MFFPLLLIACGPVEVPVRVSDWPAPVADGVARDEFPDWTFSMKVWPFDILQTDTSDETIQRRLDAAVDAGADTVIFYVQSEHMYDTFVDEEGFGAALDRVRVLTAEAERRGLHTIHYLNGLEVMTAGAYDDGCQPTGVPTMASEHADWLQQDLDGQPIVYVCQDSDWLEPDWEDAWLSPYSGYRELYAERLLAIADAGVDAVYIDATFLPGFQADEDALRWGSTDPAFMAAFEEASGYAGVTGADWDDPAWRAFLGFRHQAAADYLGDLADVARGAGMVPFFESSACDTPEGTLLANETALTPRSGLGMSPEIEPEGDWLVAWRMAHSARDLSQDRPLIYLGWPESRKAAEIEYATALAVSGTYYPTADIDVAEGAFALMDQLTDVLDQRRPYGGQLALIYSYRNRDLSWPDEATFDAYVDAWEALTDLHLPFRVRALEHLEEDGLDGVDTVVLAGLPSISDAEYAALQGRDVVVFGDPPGTLDEHGDARATPLDFGKALTVDDLRAPLPFALSVPRSAEVEYAQDADGSGVMWLSIVMPHPRGKVVVESADGAPLRLRWWALGEDADAEDGDRVKLSVRSRFTLVEVARD